MKRKRGPRVFREKNTKEEEDCLWKFFHYFWVGITHPLSAGFLTFAHCGVYLAFLVIDLLALTDSSILEIETQVQMAILSFSAINFINFALVAIFLCFLVLNAIRQRAHRRLPITERSTGLYFFLFYFLFIDSVALALDVTQKANAANPRRDEWGVDVFLLIVDVFGLLAIPAALRKMGSRDTPKTAPKTGLEPRAPEETL